MVSEKDVTIEGLQHQIKRMDLILNDIHRDLLERAETDSEGMKVVNLSRSTWHMLKKQIELNKDYEYSELQDYETPIIKEIQLC